MRSPILWYGGKGRMTSKLLPLIPRTEVYAEPYMGGASILFARAPAPCEALNDLDRSIVTLFRALQGPRFEELAHRLEWTPYSVEEFARALDIRAAHNRGETVDEIDLAWASFVAFNQGFSGTSKTRGNWSRGFVSGRGMALTTGRWMARLDMLRQFRDRLLRVQIDCKDAIEFIDYWDSPKTTLYVDPPYASATRANGNRDVYHTEATDSDHSRLVDLILAAKGCIVLSGYATPLYDRLDESGWERTEFATACYAAGRVRGSKLQGEGAALEHAARVEIVWRNPQAVRATGHAGRLFAASDFAGGAAS